MRVFFIGCAVTAAAFAQGTVSPQFGAAPARRNTLNDRVVTLDPGPGGLFCGAWIFAETTHPARRGFERRDVKGYQVLGGPSWLDVDRWEVMARVDSERSLLCPDIDVTFVLNFANYWRRRACSNILNWKTVNHGG
jgi:hypothetical protein